MIWVVLGCHCKVVSQKTSYCIIFNIELFAFFKQFSRQPVSEVEAVCRCLCRMHSFCQFRFWLINCDDDIICKNITCHKETNWCSILTMFFSVKSQYISCCHVADMYTVNHKIGDHKSANLNWFLKFFQCCKHEEIFYTSMKKVYLTYINCLCYLVKMSITCYTFIMDS